MDYLPTPSVVPFHYHINAYPSGDMPSTSSKRKPPTDSPPLPNKKPRTAAQPTNSNPSQPARTTPTSHYFLAHTPLLARLAPRYDVLTLSVLPSTNIAKHVSRALAHLTRFSAWDPALLPGVVFLSARTAGAAGKLATVAEVARRRIGESEQKWWQYNVLSEMEEEEGEEEDVVEDTFAAVGEGGGEEYFETMDGGATVHERAAAPGKVRRTGYVGVLLSRIPVGEMAGLGDVAVQTNEEGIEARRKRAGGR